ncbi:phosphate/phosphite/phosphonate ABC transporter substrate-binding protein [Halobaculum marinum]|uniref:Phosphate/phosphite/phosphonate ABC transporter substrate-binding protein n=1 Tax=Halobaculum marinum TaxID=3031996 RepID=A0ABD5WW53_9EURY|nr:phosphate/phosphite/phosphonate ABC transporter substrate-binding protein [Halobaculum sp. DT55]
MERRDFLKRTGAAATVGAGMSLSGCIGNFGSQAYGNGTVEFMVSPSEPQDYMRSQYNPYLNYLEGGIEGDTAVEFNYAADYTAVLQGLGSGTADIAETGPFAAALGVDAGQCDIALQRHAYGSWDYHSVIITREDSDIESLTDLEGGKIGFADMTSASGSLYPLYQLKEAGLSIGDAPTSTSGADFEATWSSHAQAFEALQNEQIDAAGVGRFIAWDYGKGDYVEGVREVSRESGIPRAPMIVSPELSEEEKNAIVTRLEDAPDSAYMGADGEADTDDDLWFDGVRAADRETYQPVVDVANELGLSTDLLNQGNE